MKMQNYSLVLTVFTCSALAVVGLLWITRKANNKKVPTKWKPVGKVKNLTIYPLKSGRRMELTTFTCTKFGPRVFKEGVYQFYDRNLVVFRELEKECITASTFPKLMLIKVEACSNDEFMLNAPNAPEIIVKVPRYNTKIGEVVIFKGARVAMIDCGDEVAQWLSRYIYEKDSGLLLGFHDGSRRRNIYENAYIKQFCDVYPKLTNEVTGMYSYLFSYSLINESSVYDINKRIPTQGENITAHHFRGNIIIEDFDNNSYVEDNWIWVKINDVIFYVVKPKTRCCIANIDPETSARSKNFEPFATLKSYRQLKTLKNIDLEGTEPILGIYLGLYKSGRISVEDIVYVGEP